MCTLFLGRIPIKGDYSIKILKKKHAHTEAQSRRCTHMTWDKELEKTTRKKELNQGS